MDSARLISALTPLVSERIATELVGDFMKIRQDYATKTLERATPGKFVETFVQCLQHLSRSSYDAVPKVDKNLIEAESDGRLPESLRTCGARVARSIYALRNKRNIAHKNEIDPNTFDLAFIHHASSWILAELFRLAKGISMQEAGALIDLVQVPVGDLVEEIDGVRLVHVRESAPIAEEVFILLHSHYPDRVPHAAIKSSLSRRNQGTLGNKLRELYDKKLIDGDPNKGYRLTQPGFRQAVETIRTARTM